MKNNFFRKNKKSTSRYYRNVHCVKFWCRNVENSGLQVDGQKHRLFRRTTDRKFATTNNINKEEKTTNTLNGVNAYRQLLLSSSFVTTGFALD